MLLHQSLPGGVRLRLPHRTDLDSARAFCERHDHACDVEGLLRLDPRDHAVVCAVRLTAEGETVVGLGTIRLRPGEQPSLLLADEASVGRHLRAALLARVAGRPRRPLRRSRGARLARAVTRGRAA